MAVIVPLLKTIILGLLVQSTFKSLDSVRRSNQRVQHNPSKSTIARSRRRLKLELQHWVVFVTLNAVEKLGDKFISWAIPFYGQIKFGVWLLAGSSLGSQLVYKNVFAPTVKRYESTLDMIGVVLSAVTVALLSVIMFGPNKILSWWETRRSKHEPTYNVPAIMQGLRSVQRPKLAHRLADTIESAQARLNDDVSSRLARPIVGQAAVRHRQSHKQQLPQRSAGDSTESVERHVSPPLSPIQPALNYSSSPKSADRSSTKTPRQSLYPDLDAVTTLGQNTPPPATDVKSYTAPSAPSSSKRKARTSTSSHTRLDTLQQQSQVTRQQQAIDAWTDVDLQTLDLTTTNVDQDLGIVDESVFVSPQGSRPQSFVTQTPLPPGAFKFDSISNDVVMSQQPVKVVDSRLSQFGQHGSFKTHESPRKQASRAIAGLVLDLKTEDEVDRTRGLSGWINNSDDMVVNKQRKTQSISRNPRHEAIEQEGEEEGNSSRIQRKKLGKKPRLSGHSTLQDILQSQNVDRQIHEMNSSVENKRSTSPGKRRRISNDSDDEEDDEGDGESGGEQDRDQDYLEPKAVAPTRRREARTTKTAATARTRSNIPAASRNTSTRLRASTSTREVGSMGLKDKSTMSTTVATGLPRSRSTALNRSESGIPVKAHDEVKRQKVIDMTASSARARTAPMSTHFNSSSRRSSSSSDDMSLSTRDSTLGVNKVKSSKGSSISKPPRKARRLIGTSSSTRGGTEVEMQVEVDGVPVVVGKRPLQQLKSRK
ncbi:hypothetical protein OIO90_002687 [Microbotryomycetes sp. JL221]|nr:hypothetical protein OIO90_002687 [Microbotryomycetes sp. JL221]